MVVGRRGVRGLANVLGLADDFHVGDVLGVPLRVELNFLWVELVVVPLHEGVPEHGGCGVVLQEIVAVPFEPEQCLNSDDVECLNPEQGAEQKEEGNADNNDVLKELPLRLRSLEHHFALLVEGDGLLPLDVLLNVVDVQVDVCAFGGP